MLLQPKKYKHKKKHKTKNIKQKIEYSAMYLEFGQYGLKFINSGYVTAREIEACRKIITKALRKSGKFWFRVFPDLGVTKKPAEIRMGKGKGNIDHWAFMPRKGQIFCEISGTSLIEAQQLLTAVSKKLSLSTKFVYFQA